MANKSKQELFDEFERDYSSAISYYNAKDLIHFNRDIRPAIECFGRLLIIDIVGEPKYHKIEDNLEYIDPDGQFKQQKSGRTVEGSGWVTNAKHALLTNRTYQLQDHQHKTLKKKIDSGLDQLNAQYGETSETVQHTGATIDENRMRRQSDLCVANFAALFHSLTDYISSEFSRYIEGLPKAENTVESRPLISSLILEKENALLELDEFAQGFKRQGGVKFIAILPEDASTVLGKSQLSEFFKVKWSLVIDFNPDDSSSNTLFSSAPSSSLQIVTNASDVTDGSELINWMFAKGRNSLQVFNGSSLLRSFPTMFKQTLTQMVRTGSTDNYVVVSFCGDKECSVLTKAFDKLEDIFGDWDSAENRCKIACLSNSIRFSDELTKWGEDIGIAPFMVHADIRDFVNHLPFTSTDTTNERQLIRGRSLDVTDDINRYKAAGIEFFGPWPSSSTLNIWNFYSGAEIIWQELENDCDAKRDIYIKIKNNIFDIIKNYRNNVRVFTLKHRPGSGGSTLARRLAYDVYKEDEADEISCAVIQIRNCRNVKDTVGYLSKLSEDLGNACILAIVESKNVSRNDFDNLVIRSARAKKRIIFFYLETLHGAFRDSNKTEVAFLNDILQKDENRFVQKYKSQGLTETAIKDAKSGRKDKLLEVIDFPLLLKEDISSDSLSSYVMEWMKILPDNLRNFMGYVGYVSHYSQMGLNQNLVKATWHNPAEQHYTLKGYGDDIMSAIYKLLIEEYSGDVPLGIWRPRYSKFAISLIKAAWGENWRVRLPDISKKFIHLCSQSGVLGNDDKDMLHSLYIIRRDVDFRAEDVGKKNKFSPLINDLDDPDRTASIFSTLVETYPDDSIFHGHYARFLYERASSPSSNVKYNDKLFLDAQEQLDVAFNLNPNDADLWHMQGMLIRRQLFSLKKEFEQEQNKSEEYVEGIQDTLIEWVNEALEAFDKSIEYDPSSPYGFAASCQLLKEAIDFVRLIHGNGDYSFCEGESKYTEYVDDLGERLDQFEQICHTFKENALSQITPSLKIYNDIRLFHRDLIGVGTSSINKYRDLYNSSSGEARGIYGDFLVKSILYSKTTTKDFKTAYGCLKEDERKEIEQVLLRKRDEGDLKCYDSLFKLYRYGKKEYPLDSAIDLLRECVAQYQAFGKKGWGYLNACYYLAVCYSSLAIQGDELSSELVHNATRYFDEATNLAHVFEKSSINSFCYFGEKKDIHCLVDREADGALVSGVIINIDKSKGIMRMKCGLEASFNAKGMDKFKYQGKTIQGIIGFKYSGLGLYRFGEADMNNATEEEIEVIINNSYVPDFSDDDNKVGESMAENVGLKVLGKIELPEDKLKKASHNHNQTYSGTYNKVADSITCSSKPYPVKVRTKNDNDLYDGADVLFEIGSEPNSKNPEKTYFYAINVRFKD